MSVALPEHVCNTSRMTQTPASTEAITAEYPCCGKPCRVPNAPDLPQQVVERRHFCARENSTGTLYRVDRRRLALRDGVEVNAVEFLDLASSEAVRQYGRARFARRTVCDWCGGTSDVQPTEHGQVCRECRGQC